MVGDRGSSGTSRETPTQPGVKEGSTEGTMQEGFIQRARGAMHGSEFGDHLSKLEELRQSQEVARGLPGRSR